MFDLPPSLTADVKVYPGFSPASGSDWMTWTRPARPCSMLYIICIGGGAAGGVGFTAAAGNARGGGGGGASSGVCRMMIPLAFLPDTLYVSSGVGGTVAGTKAGKISYVGIRPTTNTLDLIAQSNATAPGGGGDGTGAAGGAAGAAGTATTGSNVNLAGLGIFMSASIGQVGFAGGAQTGANGTNCLSAAGQSVPVMSNGGAGGAGCQAADFIGGTYTAVAQDIVTAFAPSAPGSSGYPLRLPAFFYGGTGGNAFNNAPGVAGGNGSYGAGGGGGGGGTTGGGGGNGGPGLVFMIAW